MVWATAQSGVYSAAGNHAQFRHEGQMVVMLRALGHAAPDTDLQMTAMPYPNLSPGSWVTVTLSRRLLCLKRNPLLFARCQIHGKGYDIGGVFKNEGEAT